MDQPLKIVKKQPPPKGLVYSVFSDTAPSGYAAFPFQFAKLSYTEGFSIGKYKRGLDGVYTISAGADVAGDINLLGSSYVKTGISVLKGANNYWVRPSDGLVLSWRGNREFQVSDVDSQPFSRSIFLYVHGRQYAPSVLSDDPLFFISCAGMIGDKIVALRQTRLFTGIIDGSNSILWTRHSLLLSIQGESFSSNGLKIIGVFFSTQPPEMSIRRTTITVDVDNNITDVAHDIEVVPTNSEYTRSTHLVRDYTTNPPDPGHDEEVEQSIVTSTSSPVFYDHIVTSGFHGNTEVFLTRKLKTFAISASETFDWFKDAADPDVTEASISKNENLVLEYSVNGVVLGNQSFSNVDAGTEFNDGSTSYTFNRAGVQSSSDINLLYADVQAGVYYYEYYETTTTYSLASTNPASYNYSYSSVRTGGLKIQSIYGGGETVLYPYSLDPGTANKLVSSSSAAYNAHKVIKSLPIKNDKDNVEVETIQLNIGQFQGFMQEDYCFIVDEDKNYLGQVYFEGDHSFILPDFPAETFIDSITTINEAIVKGHNPFDLFMLSGSELTIESSLYVEFPRHPFRI